MNFILGIFALCVVYGIVESCRGESRRRRVEEAERRRLAEQTYFGDVFYSDGMCPDYSKGPFFYPREWNDNFRKWWDESNRDRLYQYGLREMQAGFRLIKSLKLPKTKKKSTKKKAK